jgi:hypothetical protein
VKALVLLLLASTASAAPLRTSEPRRHPRLDAATSGTWTAQRDRETGVLRRMWGPPLAARRAMADPAAALAAARSFIAAHRAELAPGADLVPAANVLLDHGSRRVVSFRQIARGLPVVGGQVHVVFARDRIIAAGSDALPDVVAPSEPRIELGAALAPITAAVRWPVTATRGERVIVPVGGGYREADVFEARAAPRAWRVYVAADGTVLGRASEIAFDAGTLVYDSARWPGDPRTDAPASQAMLTVDGAAQTTGSDGSFTFAAAGSPVVAGATGVVVQVIDETGTAAAPQLAAAPTTRWSAATDEHVDAQLETYIYGTHIAAKVASFAPDLADWLAGPLDFYVNENDTCNAFSDGNAEHFFLASADCENTGRLEDVVMHEFGHSVHKHSVIDGVGAYVAEISEGFADFNAANAIEDPALGRGFRFTNNPERTIAPANHAAHYPEDDVPDPHIASLIVSGALWDLRTRLVAELGPDAGVAAAERVYVGTMQLASDFPTSYAAALVADDDNGDLSDGTPHQCEIDAAFGRHGIGPSGYVASSLAAPDLVDTGDGITVTIEPQIVATSADGCVPPQLASVVLTVDGADHPLALDGAHYVLQLPASPAGTQLHYHVQATFDDGSTATYPDNPADPDYVFLAGTLEPIACATMDTAPAWTASDAQWDWAVPQHDLDVDDPDAAHTGDHVIGTDVAQNGGKYLASATTSLTMPLPDTSGFEAAHVQFWRWLSVEDSTYDQATVSVDGAQVWQNPSNVQATFDFTDHEWRLQDFDVTGASTFTWTLAGDSLDSLGGWSLDDVCVVGVNRIGTHDDPQGGAGGCCDAGGDPRGAGLLVLLSAVALRGGRRRRRRPCS